MTRTTEWYRRKAQSLVVAWRRTFATEPTLEQIVCPLSSAIHETNAGDAWKGPDGILGTQDDERNWGACTLRALNAAESAVLLNAGLSPTTGPEHNNIAARAMATLRASGLPLPQGVIHCDSHPVVGGGNKPYFVWFASFSNDEDGAEYFLHLIVGPPAKRRPGYSALLSPALSETSLARAMYAGGYFTGVHAPADKSEAEKRKAAELNIADYARSMLQISPGIRAALKGWTPAPAVAPTQPSPALAPMLDMSQTWLDDLQRARDAQLRDA